MAGADRTQAHDLIDWSELARELRRSGLFAVVRQAEARAQDKPRVGRARRPEQSIVDLAQHPGLGFADSTLESLEFHHGRPQLRGHWLGLTGPMGAMPSHMTEFAIFERRYADAFPFGDWLDLMAGRMLQLFYRAWAESQPAALADRPGDDRFAQYLGALSGAIEGAREGASFFDRARVHYAALFAGSRSAIAIQDALSHLLDQRVEVVEYLPKWREMEVEDRSRLGRAYATLGDDAVLGRRIFSASDAFEVVVRALNYADYLSLMPGGARFSVAAEAIEAFKPSHLEWRLVVELTDADAPPARLDGKSRLGWHGWMKRPSARPSPAVRSRHRDRQLPVQTGAVRADAHLYKTSMQKRKPAR